MFPFVTALNESPSEKEGKSCPHPSPEHGYALNESPSEKEGKYAVAETGTTSPLNPQ